jgi:hypothetical protein
LERNLVRFKRDGRTVGRIDADGILHWIDFESMQQFCAQMLTGSMLESMRRGPVTEVVATVAFEIDFRSVGIAGDGSKASVSIGFDVEDRIELPRPEEDADADL